MRVRFIITLFLLLTISKNSLSQNTFSKFYNNTNGNRVSDQGHDFKVLKDSGYLFPTFSVNLFESDSLGFAKSFLQIIRINNFGDTIFRKIYRKENNYISVKYISSINDSSFILAGYVFDLIKYKADSTGAEVLLVKININGDTLWTKILGIGDGDELVSRIINTSDGGFAVFGQTCDKKETNCDYYLMKVDSNGNKLWHQTYSLNTNSWELPQSVIETKEKGFLMVGHTSGGINSVIVKTDSTGKLIWKKSFNKNGSAFSFVSNVYLAENNSYLFVGGIGNSVSHKGWILRTDSSGKFIKEIRVGKDGYYTIFISLAERDGILYAQGETKEYLAPPETENYHTCLYAFTSSGVPLWRRTYPDSLVANRRYLIYNMKPTLDNGFAMIGFGMDPKATNPQNNQDVWFLKVDSNGCLYQPCLDMTVGIEQEIETITKVHLFPNPCKDILNISLAEEIDEVLVYNSIGQLLLQENKLVNNQLNIEKIPNGFLFIKIKTKEGNIYSEKICKN